MSDNDPNHGFGDVLGSTTGIFDGTLGMRDAHAEHHRASVRPQPDGLHIAFQCQSCGTGKEVIAYWPEIVAITFGLQPHVAYAGLSLPVQVSEWRYDAKQKIWTPPSRCTCGDWLLPALSPAEASHFLSIAEGSGWINAQQLKAVCAQRRAQGA